MLLHTFFMRKFGIAFGAAIARYSKIFILASIFVCVFFLIAFSSKKCSFVREMESPEILIGINKNLISSISCGYGGFVSSALWVQVIFEYADQVFIGTRSTAMPIRLRTIMELDKKWLYPYEFYGLVVEDDSPTSQRDLELVLFEGVDRFPNSWRLRLYLALSMSRRGGASADSAVELLLPMVSRLDVPEFVRTYAFTLESKNGRLNDGMTRLIQVYSTVPDPLIQLQLRNKMFELLKKDGLQFPGGNADFENMISLLIDSDNSSYKELAFHCLLKLSSRDSRLEAKAEVSLLIKQFLAAKS